MNPQKDILIKDIGHLDIAKIKAFENDSLFYVVYKKAEGLSTATYMITNFFSGEEPIKWKMREVSLKVLKDTISLSNASMSFRESVVREIISGAVSLNSLYEVAFKSGFVSTMNYAILSKEIANFINLLDVKEKQQITVRSFAVDEKLFVYSHNRTESDMSHKDLSGAHHPGSIGQTSRASFFSQKPSNASGIIKDIQKDNKNKRQEVVLSLLKRNKQMNIKGFLSVIKDCSEKTIQRELLSLVAKGQVKKEGERRWSVYSLA